MKHILIFIIWLTGLIASPSWAMIRQQVTITPGGCSYEKIKTEDRVYHIYKHDLFKNTKRPYKIKSGDLICNAIIAHPDPTGRKLAVGSYCSPLRANNSSIYKFMIVDSRTDSEIVTLDKVGPFAFSPRGDAIVYAQPIAAEISIPKDYEPGLWIYFFGSQKSSKIDTLGVIPMGDYRPQDINWSEHDGNIYYTNYGVVFKYDVRAGKGKIVPYKGIYFSSDGKYYASKIEEGPYWTIYRTSDNQEMIIFMNTIKAEKDADCSDFQFWSKKLNAVIFRISNDKNAIFDIEQEKVIGKFDGQVVGTNPAGSLVAIHPRFKDKRGIDLSKVEIIDLTKFKR